MKAVQINSYGASDILAVQDIAKPTLKEGQVLVAVHAAAINPFDVKVSQGAAQKMMPLQFPATLGGDFAGVVSEVGNGLTEFKIGDEVFGSANVFGGGSGSFAEFVAANTKNIGKKPKSVNFEQAGALPLVGSSAVQALEEHIKLQPGQKILIHGGAGGIGSVAIQVAKAHNAYVATTVSTDDKDFVKQLGADEVIDYKKEHFEELLKEYDAVYDTVGGETTKKSFQVLKKGGILVSMLGQPDEALAKQYAVIAIGQGTKTTADHLNRVAQLVDEGKIKAQVDKVFPLDQVKEAFDSLTKNSPKGKIVLKIKE